MGTALVKIKVMPTSPDTDLKKMAEDIKALSEKNEAKNFQIEEEPIAFGLSALILSFSWSEDKELEPFENQLREIENVSSAEVTDMRRAFG